MRIQEEKIAAEKAFIVQALAEQSDNAWEAIEQAIDSMIGDVMDRTGADLKTATVVAEEKMDAIFDQVVFDVAEQLKSDTSIDEQAAHSLAKMITMKAAAEHRSPGEILSLVEGWAKD